VLVVFLLQHASLPMEMSLAEYSSPRAAPWRHVNGADHNAAFLRVVAGVAEIASCLPDIVESKRRAHEELLAADNVPLIFCLTPESYFFPEEEQQFGDAMQFVEQQVFLVPVMVCCEENYCYSYPAWAGSFQWWMQ
jgi:hypothetical protein